MRLKNDSPGVVRLESGEEQTLCVRPDDVKTNGTWTASRGLTGVRLGGFSIGAEVSTPRPHAVTESLGSEQAAKDLLTQFWSSFEDGHYMIVTTRPDLSTQKESAP